MSNTTTPRKEDQKPKWHFLDAEGQILGRFAEKAARLLIGKDKPTFANHINVGDKVVITNAEKIKVTGRKMKNKEYIWYTGYPGGLRTEALEKRFERNPKRVLEGAIKGMLPKNKLKAERENNLYIYTGAEHPHQAQMSKK